MESSWLADRWRNWWLSRNSTDQAVPSRCTVEQAVRQAYSAAAERPGYKHPFPVGRKFAESLGYPAQLLDTLPEVSVDAFTGVSNVSVTAPLRQGSKILDLGCGAGLDALIAARRVGATGLVVGIDFSSAMLARATDARAQANAQNIQLVLAEGGELPLKDASVDAALVNGIFNLNPSRDLIFRELARVVRPSRGFVVSAELVLLQPLPAPARASASNWFA